jgi:hypothetical protein
LTWNTIRHVAGRPAFIERNGAMSEPVTAEQLRTATEKYQRSVGDVGDGLTSPDTAVYLYNELLRLAGRARLSILPPSYENSAYDYFTWLQAMRDWFTWASAQLEDAPPRGEPATIWFHGGNSYSKDKLNPVCVPVEQDNVLKSFLDGNEARDTAALERAGVSNVALVIGKLVRKFGEGPIRQPENKGDGYYIRVRSLPKA